MKLEMPDSANYPALFQICNTEQAFLSFNEEWLFIHSLEYFGRKINWEETTPEITAEGRLKLLTEIINHQTNKDLLQNALLEIEQIHKVAKNEQDYFIISMYELHIINPGLEGEKDYKEFFDQLKFLIEKKLDEIGH